VLKKIFIILYTLLVNATAFAGSVRAGEITYSHQGGLTYQITVSLYTDILDTSGIPEITVNWGDLTNEIVPRIVKTNIPNYQSTRNTYIGQHTYSGPGTYIISIGGSLHRTGNIVNIPNSISTGFYIQSEIVINLFLGANNSATFLNPPLGIAYIDSIYTYNSGAVDIDADSISYKLIPCEGSGGIILGYSYPQASIIFSFDSLTCDLLWDSPMFVGYYNIVMRIEEWRQGIQVGYVIRDMQIQVKDASGIESFSNSSLIKIFPNPSINNITIETLPHSTIEISNIQGQLIKTVAASGTKTNVDVSALPCGVYVVQVKTEKGVGVRKFIKE
jgi:hypothetical protein